LTRGPGGSREPPTTCCEYSTAARRKPKGMQPMAKALPERLRFDSPSATMNQNIRSRSSPSDDGPSSLRKRIQLFPRLFPSSTWDVLRPTATTLWRSCSSPATSRDSSLLQLGQIGCCNLDAVRQARSIPGRSDVDAMAQVAEPGSGPELAACLAPAGRRMHGPRGAAGHGRKDLSERAGSQASAGSGLVAVSNNLRAAMWSRGALTDSTHTSRAAS
jgi:hypothetical protein